MACRIPQDRGFLLTPISQSSWRIEQERTWNEQNDRQWRSRRHLRWPPQRVSLSQRLFMVKDGVDASSESVLRSGGERGKERGKHDRGQSQRGIGIDHRCVQHAPSLPHDHVQSSPISQSPSSAIYNIKRRLFLTTNIGPWIIYSSPRHCPKSFSSSNAQ